MTSKRNRSEWPVEHREAVLLVEKIVALAIMLFGIGMVYWGATKFVQFAGSALGGMGLYLFFPKARPLISKVVDRLPFLAKSVPDDSPPEDAEV